MWCITHVCHVVDSRLKRFILTLWWIFILYCQGECETVTDYGLANCNYFWHAASQSYSKNKRGTFFETRCSNSFIVSHGMAFVLCKCKYICVCSELSSIEHLFEAWSSGAAARGCQEETACGTASLGAGTHGVRDAVYAAWTSSAVTVCRLITISIVRFIAWPTVTYRTWLGWERDVNNTVPT